MRGDGVFFSENDFKKSLKDFSNVEGRIEIKGVLRNSIVFLHRKDIGFIEEKAKECEVNISDFLEFVKSGKRGG